MENLNVKLVFLDNKSRKGMYVYITSKDKKPRYYKFDDFVPIDMYMNYYRDEENLGTLHQYKQAYTGTKNKKINPRLIVKSMEYLKKHKEIPRKFGNKYMEDTFVNALDANEDTIRKFLLNYFKPVVLDKDILNLLTLEDNIQRIKHRFEHKIIMKIGDTSQNITIDSSEHKTLREIVNDMKQNLRKGMTWDEISQSLRYIAGKGYTSTVKKRGNKLYNIDIKVIFRG